MRYLHKMNRPDLNEPKRLEDICLSDLWFNHNHSPYYSAEVQDYVAMQAEAETFLCCLKNLGVDTSELDSYMLVEDFLARV